MKNLTYFLLSGSLLFMSCERDKIVDEAALPAAEKQYLDTHFASIPISRVERETKDNMTSYEVWLQNRIEVEFNAYGQAVHIDGQRTEHLPNSVIPSKILEYVDLQYSEQYIVEWEKDKHDQQIQLSNGTELIFDLEGTFIRMDD